LQKELFAFGHHSLGEKLIAIAPLHVPIWTEDSRLEELPSTQEKQ
jgi:hypothetical protein